MNYRYNDNVCNFILIVSYKHYWEYFKEFLAFVIAKIFKYYVCNATTIISNELSHSNNLLNMDAKFCIGIVFAALHQLMYIRYDIDISSMHTGLVKLSPRVLHHQIIPWH